MHGGIGVTYEHDIHLYLRRITVDRVTLRDPGRPPAAHRRTCGSARRMTATETRL